MAAPTLDEAELEAALDLLVWHGRHQNERVAFTEPLVQPGKVAVSSLDDAGSQLHAEAARSLHCRQTGAAV